MVPILEPSSVLEHRLQLWRQKDAVDTMLQHLLFKGYIENLVQCKVIYIKVQCKVAEILIIEVCVLNFSAVAFKWFFAA